MAWTAPSTWAAAAVLTAAQLNQQLRDNMLAIGTGTAFTPTWTNVTQGTTGLVNTGHYSQAGKWITVQFNLTLGTGGAFTGSATMTLPFPAASSVVAGEALGVVRMQDTSAPLRRNGLVLLSTSTTAIFAVENATPASVTANATVPFTWAATDLLSGTFTYLAA